MFAHRLKTLSLGGLQVSLGGLQVSLGGLQVSLGGLQVSLGGFQVILVRTLSDKELGDHVLTVVVHDLGFPTQLAKQTLLYIHVYRDNQSVLATSSDDKYVC